MTRTSRFAPPGLASLAGLGLLAACAPETGPEAASSATGERQCFRAEQVNGFGAVDDDTVRINVGANDVYELELFGPCQDIDWSQRIGIRATGGSNWICRGLDAELIVPSPIGPSQCQISSIRQLSDAEIRTGRERDGD